MLALLLASRTGAADAPSAALRTAYQDAARLLCNDAAGQFRARLGEPGAAGREARLGLAASLLNVQPRTDGNVREADAFLQQVIAANGADDAGIAATYLRGRIAQLHRQPADPAAAVQLFLDLYRAHPAHPLAQMAWVKAVTLRLYDPGATPAARRAVFDEAEATLDTLADPDARRDGHASLAAGCERFGYGDERRLRHLLAQEAIGARRPDARRDLSLSIAELARRLGRGDVAAEHYRRFLDEAPRDARRYAVERRLAGNDP